MSHVRRMGTDSAVSREKQSKHSDLHERVHRTITFPPFHPLAQAPAIEEIMASDPTRVTRE